MMFTIFFDLMLFYASSQAVVSTTLNKNNLTDILEDLKNSERIRQELVRNARECSDFQMSLNMTKYLVLVCDIDSVLAERHKIFDEVMSIIKGGDDAKNMNTSLKAAKENIPRDLHKNPHMQSLENSFVNCNEMYSDAAMKQLARLKTCKLKDPKSLGSDGRSLAEMMTEFKDLEKTRQDLVKRALATPDFKKSTDLASYLTAVTDLDFALIERRKVLDEALKSKNLKGLKTTQNIGWRFGQLNHDLINLYSRVDEERYSLSMDLMMRIRTSVMWPAERTMRHSIVMFTEITLRILAIMRTAVNIEYT